MHNSFALNLAEFKQFCCYALSNISPISPIDKQIINFPSRFKKCAVLLPFWHDSQGDLQIILTVRSKQLKFQPGQISFPGGKWEEDDLSLINTAIRETTEEIAIPQQQIQTLGILPKLALPSGYEIYPVLSYIKPETTWQNTTAEVDDVFCLPCHIALDINQYHTKIINHQSIALNSHHLLYLNYDIWGATANILYRLAYSYHTYQYNELSR